MAAATPCAAARPQRYQRRRPEQTLWYRTVQAHFATWLELASGPCGESPPAYEQALKETRGGSFSRLSRAKSAIDRGGQRRR